MFEKGHPYYPPKEGIPPGKRKDDVVNRRSLALALRSIVHPDEIAHVLRSIAIDGRDPSAPEGQAYSPPDWPVRLAALKMLLERQFGAPQDASVLEDEIKRLMQEAADAGRGNAKKLSETELAAYRALQRKARGLPALAPPVTRPAVVDVEAAPESPPAPAVVPSEP